MDAAGGQSFFQANEKEVFFSMSLFVPPVDQFTVCGKQDDDRDRGGCFIIDFISYDQNVHNSVAPLPKFRIQNLLLPH